MLRRSLFAPLRTVGYARLKVTNKGMCLSGKEPSGGPPACWEGSQDGDTLMYGVSRGCNCLLGFLQGGLMLVNASYAMPARFCLSLVCNHPALSLSFFFSLQTQQLSMVFIGLNP